MQVKYYKVGLMAYATRQRYLNISSFEPYKEEDNRSVRLGNGANTSVKTNIDYLDEPREVTYVTIEGTRWFVTDFIYLNSKQVQFNLQRDVVGEFGLGSAYGRIERGYTDGILKYRKELSLNEVLKKRTPLKSSTFNYGNITVDNHDNEMWGILYFTRDATQDKVSINIPSFEPVYDLRTPPLINNPNGSAKFYSAGVVDQNFEVIAGLYLFSSVGSQSVKVKYTGQYSADKVYSSSISYTLANYTKDTAFWVAKFEQAVWSDGLIDELLGLIKEYLDANQYSHGFTLPKSLELMDHEREPYDANGLVYKEGDNFYEYTATRFDDTSWGGVNVQFLAENITQYIVDKSIRWTVVGYKDRYISASSNIVAPTVRYSRRKLSAAEAGSLEIPMTQQFVDEPYCILVFPLYDVNIKIGASNYNIERTRAFTIFNDVIANLSGANPFLVDAQIYPYCPNIDKVQTSLLSSDGKSYPFMSVLSTRFETPTTAQLMPYLDVKKEYITRNYSIVSPDQSSKFTFNFYDYVNSFHASAVEEGHNDVYINIKIKTALKPFSIISSAVITRVNSLKGLNYESNLEGSQSASGGFECSLASDAFETYKRQNSNYQQLFDIDRNELRKSQEVERVNEATQFAMNMVTGTAFGAIAGGSLADVGLANTLGVKAAGAAVGAGVSAAAIGATGGIQLAKNDELRAYEREIQQQRFDLTIGTIKNLPNSVNRISSFNEIIMQDFYYVLETYECTNEELQIVNDFIQSYGYGIGVFDFIKNYQKNNWFIKASVLKSELPITLHQTFKNDLEGGIYINE